MKILYKNKKVEKVCTDEKEARKQFGQEVANKLGNVIYLLHSSNNLKDLLLFPQYHLHMLKGNLEGIFSVYLGKTTGYRLLLIPLDENEKLVKSDDMSIYTKTVCVEIEEVSKHYGK